MTNYEKIKNMDINTMAKFLESLLDDRNTAEIGCYNCIYYGTHHADIAYKKDGLYTCDGCSSDGIGYDLVKYLSKEEF